MRVPIDESRSLPDAFERRLREVGHWPLRARSVQTVQLNLGKRCNQACLHCHVEAGPRRHEQMSEAVIERVLSLCEAHPALDTVDLTGGAPEMHPQFPMLVQRLRPLVGRLIDRCNLTILSEPGFDDLARFLAEQRVDVVASLPCYLEANVDAQRGKGVFRRSIEGLRQLNALGYGRAGGSLRLSLVYNPGGPSLPPPQAELELQYREALARHGIEFNELLVMTNVPMRRFAAALEREGRSEAYQALLEQRFNPATVAALMCRTQVSVGFDGRVYDCDFHQMSEIAITVAGRAVGSVFELSSWADLEQREVRSASHCFACTAGSGSSCGGALVQEPGGGNS